MSSVSLISSAASELMTDVSFTTTVAGKNYSASVTYSNGEYVASDPNLAGAEASGSSVMAAENSLSERIDILV